MSLFSGGRGILFGGGRVIIFSLLSGLESQFFSNILGEGHNFFKSFYTMLQRELVFTSYLFCPFRQRKKCPEGKNKTIYMNLDVRYGILKERQTDRRILLFYCYVQRFHQVQSLDISIKYRNKFELHVYSSTQ